MNENIFKTLAAEIAACDFLHSRSNPVLTKGGDAQHLSIAINNYCHLPRTIVGLLRQGLTTLENHKGNRWQSVIEDIEQNIDDETGGRTGGVPHFTILQQGVKRELGLEISVRSVADHTFAFVDALDNGLQDSSVAYVAGVLWALEATAVPELKLVADALNAFAKKVGRPETVNLNQPLPGDVTDWTDISLQHFLRLHIGEIEIDHRDGLKRAILNHLVPAENRRFRAGVHLTLCEMAVWWRRMAR